MEEAFWVQGLRPSKFFILQYSSDVPGDDEVLTGTAHEQYEAAAKLVQDLTGLLLEFSVGSIPACAEGSGSDVARCKELLKAKGLCRGPAWVKKSWQKVRRNLVKLLRQWERSPQ